MKRYLAPGLAWVATLLTTFAANAAVLDFAGLDALQLEQPLNYYAGGFGSLGSGPGPNYGVSFPTGDPYTCVGPPIGTCGTALVPTGNPLIPGQGPITMNVADGFKNELSFFYSFRKRSGSEHLQRSRCDGINSCDFGPAWEL